MAYEPGGYSEKLGNRYEGRWVACQLLLLLNEQFRSITLESVGDDETGVDLWIGHNDGSREAQQCKGENGTKAHWTLADLKSRRVLDHLRYQLNRDPLNRFTFVSSSQAPQLRDLSRSARDSKGDPESFYFDQIRNGSYARQANFTDWCKYLELKESDINDRAVAFDLLRRSDFHPFSDDKQEREILRLIAQQAVIGDVDAVLALLADKYAIRILIPCLNRIVKQKLQEKRAWRKRMSSHKFVPYPQTRIPPIFLATLRAAMVALSRTSPKAFSQLSNRLGKVPSRAVQSLLIHAWSATKPLHADNAIHWLLADQRRIRCGSQKRKPRWCAAARLVRRMSPHCSDEVFVRLEQTLLKFRDPDEKRLASLWLRETRDGFFGNQFFAAQRFLLPALAPTRRSIDTTSWIGVLKRKYAEYSLDSFCRPKPIGGWVRSPLNNNNLNRISDKKWLRLIGNQQIPRRDGRWRPRKDHGAGIEESSVEMFARDFGVAAKREPERFGHLALKLPENSPADYISEIFNALHLTKPPEEVPQEQREGWQPASRECVDRLLQSINLPDDSSAMRSFCWLVHYREMLIQQIASLISSLN